MKKWLASQPRPATLAELQQLLDTFGGICNTQRPNQSRSRAISRIGGHHRSRRTAPPRPPSTPPAPKPHPATVTPTPTTASAATASTTPASSPCATTGNSTTSASAGPTPGPHVLLLIQDLHIRVINAATGELLRELTLEQADTTPDAPARRPGSRCAARKTRQRGLGVDPILTAGDGEAVIGDRDGEVLGGLDVPITLRPARRSARHLEPFGGDAAAERGEPLRGGGEQLYAGAGTVGGQHRVAAGDQPLAGQIPGGISTRSCGSKRLSWCKPIIGQQLRMAGARSAVIHR